MCQWTQHSFSIIIIMIIIKFVNKTAVFNPNKAMAITGIRSSTCRNSASGPLTYKHSTQEIVFLENEFKKRITRWWWWGLAACSSSCDVRLFHPLMNPSRALRARRRSSTRKFALLSRSASLRIIIIISYYWVRFFNCCTSEGRNVNEGAPSVRVLLLDISLGLCVWWLERTKHKLVLLQLTEKSNGLMSSSSFN